ncbi:MAG: hypothetical protein C4548_13105 [Desulfobacteraceae bacterium]|nr:MAG: hypothetical protein C4548_13105 [Desulfobacteraceae bacterium]
MNRFVWIDDSFDPAAASTGLPEEIRTSAPLSRLKKTVRSAGTRRQPKSIEILLKIVYREQNRIRRNKRIYAVTAETMDISEKDDMLGSVFKKSIA